MIVSIAEVLIESARVLRVAGVPDARREAGSLLAHVLKQDRTFIISHAEDSIGPQAIVQFRSLVERRANGEPQQYLTGHQEFFRLDFQVTPDVLIPRPETELLVETALDLIPENDAAFVFSDVGTGSGCIAVSLLHERTQAQAVGIDISEKALRVAKQNALTHSVAERMLFVRSDCFRSIQDEPVFDLIVSNPPYVAEAAVAELQREVRDYEPRVALTAGPDGLDMIRRLLVESIPLLKSGGHLLIEIGFDQREVLEKEIDRKTWQLLEIYKDLQGIPRTLALKKL
jgi:release factor glutamine methyltransferase